VSQGEPEERGRRIWVEDDQGRRPFMRGIMVHSLMSRGVAFDEAYRAASTVRERLRGRDVVRRDELAQLVSELLGDEVEERPLHYPRQVRVTERDKSTPFSKGVLAQSLLAAAITPDQAFTVARQIEAELLAREAREIDRTALRELAAKTLERTLGERVAARYRTWRSFLESGRPLILLLVGTAGSGKTSLAQEVSHRLGISRVVSTDAIRQIMRIMLSRELAPAIHASSYDAYRIVPGIESGADAVIEGFRDQAQTVSVGVKAMMDRAVEENTSMILEGVSILPGLIDPARWRNEAHVVFLAIATLDPLAFKSRFEARGGASHRPPHRYLENLDAILRIQDDVLELAEHHDVPIVDNQNFDETALSILRHVTETLREQGDGREAR
jgi:2-phosphoglycerate kinase